MLTKNAKIFILEIIMNCGSSGYAGSPYPSRSFLVKAINGLEKTTGTGTGNTAGFINALNHMAKTGGRNSTTYIQCGTGTTAATEDDYRLESIATGLNCESVVTAVGNNYSKTYTAIFSNTTNADIIVTEIGFFITYPTTGDSSVDYYLLDRTVLTTPITIPAGESKAITYELGF